MTGMIMDTIQKIEKYRSVYLTAQDIKSAVSLIYNAYRDDPCFRAILYKSDEQDYEKKLRGAIRDELLLLWQQEQTLVGLFERDRLVGVACIVSQEFQLGHDRSWSWRIKMLLNTGWQPTKKIIKKETSIVEHLPRTNSLIIQFCCIHPYEQKKGLGTHLIKSLCQWCDEQKEIGGIAVFLNQSIHIKLFYQCGFKLIHRFKIANVNGELSFYQNNNYIS